MWFTAGKLHCEQKRHKYLNETCHFYELYEVQNKYKSIQMKVMNVFFFLIKIQYDHVCSVY